MGHCSCLIEFPPSLGASEASHDTVDPLFDISNTIQRDPTSIFEGHRRPPDPDRRADEIPIFGRHEEKVANLDEQWPELLDDPLASV
jgi:hypothetical protein